MTADSKTVLAERLTKATAAVASFPTGLPDFGSVTVRTNGVRLYFDPSRAHGRWVQAARDIAQLAKAFSATITFQKAAYTSRRELAVEFVRLDVRFWIDCDFPTQDARELAEALGRKLPTKEPHTLTAKDLLAALDTVESA